MYLRLSMDDGFCILHILRHLEPTDATPSHGMFDTLPTKSIYSNGNNIFSICESTLVSQRSIHYDARRNGNRQQRQEYSSELFWFNTRIPGQTCFSRNLVSSKTLVSMVFGFVPRTIISPCKSYITLLSTVDITNGHFGPPWMTSMEINPGFTLEGANTKDTAQ